MLVLYSIIAAIYLMKLPMRIFILLALCVMLSSCAAAITPLMFIDNSQIEPEPTCQLAQNLNL